MKRWSRSGKDHVENKKIDAFLKEVIAVCKKHGLSISHEDTQGSFVIEEYETSNAQWLLVATDRTKPSEGKSK